METEKYFDLPIHTYLETSFQQVCLNLARYRKERDLTQEELAELTGVSRDHIAHLEAPGSASLPSMDTVFTIAYHLHIPAYMFYMREEDWNLTEDEEPGRP